MRAATEKKVSENVEILVVDSSGTLREDVGAEELPGYLSYNDALVWCDVSSIEGGQSGPYGRLLAKTFRFDLLTVEDSFTASHLPKVDDYGSYLFMVLFSFRLSQKEQVHTAELDMYLGENYVVCVHSEPLKELDRVRKRLRSGDRFISSSAANVAHTVLDAVVDEYLPIMDTMFARVER